MRHSAFLKAGTSVLAGAVWIVLLAPQAALAQTPASLQQAELDAESDAEIVVTGSSIRGIPPVGSALIEVTRAEIEATGGNTVQDVLATIPQLQTFNTAPRPDPRPGQGPQSSGPNLRGLGPQQTLSLINGHRLVPIGTLQNLADPAIVAPAALARIEVVADGASSVYGSDAIAGVVNVITRTDIDGGEISASYGNGSRFSTANVDAVLGKRWSDGFLMGSASYNWASAINGQQLDFFNSDRRAVGGANNLSRNCADPTLRTGNVNYAFPALVPGTFNECDNGKFADIYPEQTRANFLVSGRQALSGTVEIFGDASYTVTTSNYMFGPGTPGAYTINNTNPFFRPIPGVPATSYSVTSSLAGITGRDMLPQRQRATAYNIFLGIDVDLPGGFKLTATGLGGESYIRFNADQFDPAAVTRAAAGTTLATALDPFGGRTSAAVLDQINNSELIQDGRQTLYEGQVKIDGALFALPGGDVKVAVGGVARKETFNGQNSTGEIGAAVPASLGLAGGDRTIYSAYGEMFIPLFSEANAVPGLRRLDLSISGRYDRYSDFGGTFNPKFGANWSPVDGLTLRASYGTSFHAPQLADLFGPDSRATFTPNLTGITAPANNQNIPSISLAGSNIRLDPETAKTYSFGLDVAPASVPGLRLSGTYYNIDFRNQVGFPIFALIQTDPGYQQFVYRNPSADLVRQLVGDLRTINFTPDNIPTVAQVLDLRRVNLSQILTQGIDFTASYRFGTSFGAINASITGNHTLSYKTRTTSVAPEFDQIEAGGIPTVPWGVRGVLDISARQGHRLNIAANWSSGYKNAYVTNTALNAIEAVSSYFTMDVRGSINIANDSFPSGTNLELSVDNVFDRDPPIVRSGNGIGRGNILGRVFTVGLRQKF